MVCIAVGERVRRKLIRLTMQVVEAEVESQLAIEVVESSSSRTSSSRVVVEGRALVTRASAGVESL